MTQPVRAGASRPLPTVRFDPFREIEDAWSRMGSLLGDVVGSEHRSYGALGSRTAAVDVEETDEAFVVELETPGVRADDLSIDLRDNELSISGEIRAREREGTLRRQGRRTGRFEQQITLPGEVNPDAVTAALDCGVLTVRLPKARRSEPHHIRISGPTAAAEQGSTQRLG
ncbi:heat-shock protein Hsp20 [Parafrankia colletiae]|uniref:Heat-shock protein Hsp20 n=1 Tax=Parafrankia colletiae TaxID=573497 RepID=A0A1S1R5F2_9ACTN|nr:Hsp20/alpha crystallin family protein [Parafrankia colletiae]MCK9901549.1 Hsp20/alpha crystallin family protein [Frankia sp. Cpl3]OHV41127.1 heat-shock protein Hsp20 [Parafrankia colletiae]